MRRCGDYRNRGLYIQRRDQKRMVGEDALERALLEGAESGMSSRSVLDIMAAVETRTRANREP